MHDGTDPPHEAVDERLARTRIKAALFGVHEPQQIGRYTVLGKLGEGGMGVVYAASDDVLGRQVAIKLLHRRDDESAARMRREARALARLNHPNVVTVYEVDQVEDWLFVVMEFIAGETLRGWLAQRRTPREIAAVLAQAGAGLQAAHAVGLVHRDFKPDNVMVGADGRVRVLDFGLATGAGGVVAPIVGGSEDVDPRLTRTGQLLGTPAYAAPEQRRGGLVDARSDQYAFCVVLHEALIGVRPAVNETTVDDASLAPLAGAPILTTALLRGLAEAPADRHADMRPLVAALTDAFVQPQVARARWGRLGAAVFGVGVFAAAGITIATMWRPADAPAPASVAATDAGAEDSGASEAAMQALYDEMPMEPMPNAGEPHGLDFPLIIQQVMELRRAMGQLDVTCSVWGSLVEVTTDAELRQRSEVAMAKHCRGRSPAAVAEAHRRQGLAPCMAADKAAAWEDCQVFHASCCARVADSGRFNLMGAEHREDPATLLRVREELIELEIGACLGGLPENCAAAADLYDKLARPDSGPAAVFYRHLACRLGHAAACETPAKGGP